MHTHSGSKPWTAAFVSGRRKEPDPSGLDNARAYHLMIQCSLQHPWLLREQAQCRLNAGKLASRTRGHRRWQQWQLLVLVRVLAVVVLLLVLLLWAGSLLGLGPLCCLASLLGTRPLLGRGWHHRCLQCGLLLLRQTYCIRSGGVNGQLRLEGRGTTAASATKSPACVARPHQAWRWCG